MLCAGAAGGSAEGEDHADGFGAFEGLGAGGAGGAGAGARGSTRSLEDLLAPPRRVRRHNIAYDRAAGARWGPNGRGAVRAMLATRGVS